MSLQDGSCRVCGIRLPQDTLFEHELNCLEKSQENVVNMNSSEQNYDNQAGAYSPKNQLEEKNDSKCSPDKISSNEHSTSAMSPYPPLASNNQIEVEKTANSNPVKTSESSSTTSIRYDRKKSENLFPPTKKYSYFPVTCEYCRETFQPNKLKAHQRKHHFSETEDAEVSRKTESTPARKGASKKRTAGRSKSAGIMPKALQICYICGRLYGSKSLPLHEPKCLEKWRIQNEQLPSHLRAPEPTKPQSITPVAENKGYSVPEFDPTAEAAFRSHLSTLIPCIHCNRTFSPDRIQKHISCCIERPKPKTRDCITPAGREKKW